MLERSVPGLSEFVDKAYVLVPEMILKAGGVLAVVKSKRVLRKGVDGERRRRDKREEEGRSVLTYAFKKTGEQWSRVIEWWRGSLRGAGCGATRHMCDTGGKRRERCLRQSKTRGR